MDQPINAPRTDFERAIRPFALPIGLASPMWLAYGAAATVGATWWWMSRITRFAAPTLAPLAPRASAEPVVTVLEAPRAVLEHAAAPAPVETIAAPQAVEEPVEVMETALVSFEETALAAPEAEEASLAPEPDVASEPALEPVPAAAPVIAETAEPQDAPKVEEITDRPDELTLLRGVGPRVADALVARGVTTFAQLAAWSEHDMAHFDKELKLLGRSKRYDFLGQARELAASAD